MQVKERLKINAVVIIMSIVGMLLVLSVTAYHINKAIEANRMADAIITTAFERLALRTDYMRTGSERARDQVAAKYKQISELLKAASERFTAQEDKMIVDTLRESNESVGKIFRAIVANRKDTEIHGRSDTLSREVEDRLLSQLNMRVYESVVLGSKLRESSTAALLSALKKGGGGIFFVLLLVGVVVLINSGVTYRSISARIGRLRDGAVLVGEGNLDRKIGIKGDDEFAVLSDAFDAMTLKLRGSYQNLEKEIEERKRVEEALRKAHDELELRVQERTKELTEAYGAINTERQRLYDVLETLPVMICLMTPDYHVAFSNKSFRDRFGESHGRHCYDYCFGKTGPCDFCESYNVLKTGQPHYWEVTGPDGSVIAAYDFPFSDIDGSPLILEMDIDITGQRLTEKALKDLNETLERRVAERMGELESANTLLRNSRKAALNIMEDALAARRAAEESSIKLLREVAVRKKIEKALRSNEAILKQAGQMANLGAWEISISNHDDLNANPLHWSDEVYRIFGYEPGEVLVSNNLFFERVHPDDRRLVMDAISKALATRTPYSIEHRITRPDGVERIVLEHAEISYDTQGGPVQIIGAVQDITEYKRAETELRRLTGDLEKKVSERTRFYSIRAKISEAIVRIHDQQILFDEVCRVIVEEGSFRLAWIGIVDPESRRVLPVSSFGESSYLQGLRIVAADVPEGKGPTGRAVCEDHYVINTDFEVDPRLQPWRGRARAHGLRSSSAFPLHRGGQVMGALTIYADRPSFFTEEEITLLLSLSQDISFALESMEIEKKRRVAVEALRVLNEELDIRVQKRTIELQEVNRELEAFIYSISHDLRAPVRTMAGFARFLAEDYEDRLDDQAKDYLKRINLGSEKMTLLINDLLRLSKISRQEIERMDIDLSKLASSVISGLRASDPGRSVEVLIAEGLTAFADPRLMEIVLSNLLGNAWKFTSQTENAQMEFGVRRTDGDGIYFIRDNGAGFNPEYMEKMFWPFQRLHSEEEFEGTGIGLTIVERIIRRHGGKVWAEGKIGKGATIYFTLGQNRV